MARIVVDVEQLTMLKSTFDQQGSQIAEVVSALNSQLANTVWEGPSADALRAQWSEEFQPALQRLEAALQAAGQDIDRRVSNYQANG